MFRLGKVEARGMKITCFHPSDGFKDLILLQIFSVPQFRYKTRVYKQTNLDEKLLTKLHTKVLPMSPFLGETYFYSYGNESLWQTNIFNVQSTSSIAGESEKVHGLHCEWIIR